MRYLAGKLLFLVAVVFAASTVFVSGAYAFGRIQLPPTTLNRLGLLDCVLPCWLGIVPGETPFEDAAQRVTDAFPDATIVMRRDHLSVLLPENPFFIAVVQAYRGTVNRIDLVPIEPSDLVLGDVVGLFGAPTCAASTTHNRPIRYLGARMSATIVENLDSDERWHRTVHTIAIVGNQSFRC